MKQILITCGVAISLMAACKSGNGGKTETPAEPTQTEKTETVDKSLDGTWELVYIMGPGKDLATLYGDKKPTITFDVAGKKVNGYSGCNRFNGPLNVNGHRIRFENMAMTRMACPGEGENVFMGELEKVNTFSVSDGTLHFIMGDIVNMTFERPAK